MNDTIYEHYLRAGKIASKVRGEAVSRVKEGVSLLSVAEYVEKRVEELGGKNAFPCNISINETASHYTPFNHLPCFNKGDVVKIDIGVHIDGFIADTATTVEVGTDDHGKLIEASQRALEKAISGIKDGTQTRNIGKIIGETIKKYGFNPIKDLTGHSLERYRLHAGMTIPNYKTLFSQNTKKDMVFAIEPFVTYGTGRIRYGKSHILALNGRGKGKLYQQLMDRFCTLPFARRWIPDVDLDGLKGIIEYFELIEAGNEIVAQSEHTVIVNENGCEVITR